MEEKLSALRVNLRMLLKRTEELHIGMADYKINAELQKAELKADELNDIISRIEVLIND
jgi:hypothetical protein